MVEEGEVRCGSKRPERRVGLGRISIKLIGGDLEALVGGEKYGSKSPNLNPDRPDPPDSIVYDVRLSIYI